MPIQAGSIATIAPFNVATPISQAENTKGMRLQNEIRGYQAEQDKAVSERLAKKREIEQMYAQMPARIRKYRDMGMYREAQEAIGALITGKKQELEMTKIVAQVLTTDNWKRSRQDMIEAGAIDGSQMPTEFSQAWIDDLLRTRKGDYKKLVVEFGEVDAQGKPTGRTMEQTRIQQDGEYTEGFEPFETDASKKARGVHKGAKPGGSKPWQVTSGDTGQLKQMAAEQFDTILDKDGNFVGLRGEDKRKALQLVERASEIYNSGRGQIPHGEAVAQAAREQGLPVKSTRQRLINDPAGIRTQ